MLPRLLEDGIGLRGPVNLRTSGVGKRNILVVSLVGLGHGERGFVGDRNVGKLAVVGRSRGAEGIPRLERIRVHVVTSGLGDRIGKVPGVDQGKVVRAIVEANRVLVKERGVANRIRWGRERGGEYRRERGVVRLIVTILALEEVLQRDVARLVGEEHNRMRETDVKARTARRVLEGGALGLLDLVDKDITRSITHLNSLVIVDDRVVSKGLHTAELGGSISGDTILILNYSSNVNGPAIVEGENWSGVDHHQLFPVTEIIGDLDVIKGEGSHGERNTGILTKEEGEGKVEGSTRNIRSNKRGRGKGAHHPNHVEITLALVTRASPFKVIVEPEAVKFLNLEIVELNLHVLDKVVHEVIYPTNRSHLASESTDRGVESNRGEPSAKEGRKDVITLTRERERSFASSKLGGSTNVAEADRDVREPVSLLHRGHKPGDGIGSTIEETLRVAISCQVDKCDRCGDTRIRHLNNADR